MLIRVRASQLAPGDRCTGSGLVIARVVLDGYFMRSTADHRLPDKWPKGKVEIKTTDGIVRYWGKNTTMTVERKTKDG